MKFEACRFRCDFNCDETGVSREMLTHHCYLAIELRLPALRMINALIFQTVVFVTSSVFLLRRLEISGGYSLGRRVSDLSLGLPTFKNVLSHFTCDCCRDALSLG